MLGKHPRGIVTALVTPIQEDESIDYGVWKDAIKSFVLSGIDGLFSVGSQG
jgi:dihydrodipicolinate synthase/N-acetylneuraminate lyase